MTTTSSAAAFTTPASINGVLLHRPDEAPSVGALRQRACTELLRQASIRAGLLDPGDPAPDDGVISEAASQAIETLLDGALQLPEPSDEACRRHYAANAGRHAVGERVHARHVLFAVTPGVDVVRLRARAEACLLSVRCHEPGADDPFTQAARTTSNCPSGADGGELGWLAAEDCAPEFARELFGRTDVGVLPRLVHSRFGLHVVEVMARKQGSVPAFETVRAAVAQSLHQQAFATALRQYLQQLAGQARLVGVELDADATPLAQ